jgi:8-oxo-dGTP diphosphatase
VSEVIEVAAAIVRDVDGRVLLSRRPAHKHQGDCWEFPGGKREPGESMEEALARELDEELGLIPRACRPFMTIDHDYADRRVRLCFREVTDFTGSPRGREGQPVDWFYPEALRELSMPAANRPLVTALRLPDAWAILPEDLDEETFVRALPARAQSGHGIYLRGLETRPAELQVRAAQCREHGLAIMIRDEAELARSVNADVLHLSADTGKSLTEKPEFEGLVSMACHNRTERDRALALDMDQILLSPVAATPTHPGATPLGWSGLAELATGIPVPVYALGGVTPADLDRARQAGARGIAGISAFW